MDRQEVQAGVDRIESIVLQRRPDLASLIAALRRGPIDQATADELQLALVDELMAYGVDQDGEVNEYGVAVDDLIDVVQDRVFEAGQPIDSSKS